MVLPGQPASAQLAGLTAFVGMDGNHEATRNSPPTFLLPAENDPVERSMTRRFIALR
jgi:hypothetical protein